MYQANCLFLFLSFTKTNETQHFVRLGWSRINILGGSRTGCSNEKSRSVEKKLTDVGWEVRFTIPETRNRWLVRPFHQTVFRLDLCPKVSDGCMCRVLYSSAGWQHHAAEAVLVCLIDWGHYPDGPVWRHSFSGQGVSACYFNVHLVIIVAIISIFKWLRAKKHRQNIYLERPSVHSELNCAAIILKGRWTVRCDGQSLKEGHAAGMLHTILMRHSYSCITLRHIPCSKD